MQTCTLLQMVATHGDGAQHAAMIEWLTDQASVRELSDKDLLAAYLRTDGASAEADILSAEIERRDLDT